MVGQRTGFLAWMGDGGVGGMDGRMVEGKWDGGGTVERWWDSGMAGLSFLILLSCGLLTG